MKASIIKTVEISGLLASELDSVERELDGFAFVDFADGAITTDSETLVDYIDEGGEPKSEAAARAIMEAHLLAEEHGIETIRFTR